MFNNIRQKLKERKEEKAFQKMINEMKDLVENGARVQYTAKGGTYVEPLHIIVSDYNQMFGCKKIKSV